MEASMDGTLAIVDNDRNSLTLTSTALKSEGFGIRPYTDGYEALRGLAARPADLVILENKLPGMNGLDVLRHLRKDSALPIMILTSNADEIDQLMGLRMGADAYIMKPVSMRLIIERVRVLLRGTRREPIIIADDEPVIQRGDLHLDPTRHQCRWQGVDVRLTVREFHLLRSLALQPGHVKTRDQLMKAVNNTQASVYTRSIDSHMKRLRIKLKMVDPHFSQIETLYSLGYRFLETPQLIHKA
jgi:two-component system response regulator ChvI